MQINAVERNAERFCVVVSACELLNSVVAAVVEAECTDYFMLPASPVQGRGGINTSGEKDETFHGGGGKRKSGGAVFRVVLGGRSEAYAAACAEATDYAHPVRGGGCHEIVEDTVDYLLIEGGIVTE